MKTVLFSFIGLIFATLILPVFSAPYKGQYVSQSYLTNSTNLYFDYTNMQDFVVFGDNISAANTNYKKMKYDKEINGGKNWITKLIDIQNHKVWLWDYAHNGAVVDFNLVPRDEENTSFNFQYDKFIDNLCNKPLKRWSSKSTLFTIWFGTNDIIYMNHDQGVSSRDIIDNIIRIIFDKVQGLYNHGAKNFLFIYVPTIEKSPLNKDNSLYLGYSDTTYYNDKIKNYAINFANTHSDCNVFIYDAYMEYNYILENKEEFGIENISDNCQSSKEKCGKDTKYFWYNDIQPSYRVQEALGQDIHEFLTSRQVVIHNSKVISAASTINFKNLLL